MKVQNRKCIRKLSFKSLLASRKRNLIAVSAIALTALLFTSLLTIALSINSSYETYQFRELGGYCHGTFKDVTEEQAASLSSHPKVKAAGARKVIGFCDEGVFAKVPGEVSFMDDNCAKWSYAIPTTGRMPESGREIAMDTGALDLLGIEPELGAEISLTYTVGDKSQLSFTETGTFTLVGYWEFDPLMPVHYLNVTQDYAAEIEAKGMEAGMDSFRMDLNVMLASSVDIQGQMAQVDTDLGYTWDSYTDENSARIGVNPGYTASQLDSLMNPETVLAMGAFILLVIFTGYLIIYNIFQISVTGDIRFYGLLKTIGTTPRQLRRVIRQQALLLYAVGIPLGLLLGYGIGALLTPAVLSITYLGTASSTISTSPVIFLGSALFALVTVLLSCSRPGRMAGRVSPVEAAKYTDAVRTGKKRRATRGAKVHQMAFANLGRNRRKTVLVVLSLSLSVTLLNILYTFVSGFDMEKYVSANTCADFIVSSTDYFRFNPAEEYIPRETLEEIEANTEASLSGIGYSLWGINYLWVEEDALAPQYALFQTQEAEDPLASKPHRGSLVMEEALLEGLDRSLFDKITVVDGTIEPLFQEDGHFIAVEVFVDDYGKVADSGYYPKVGDTLTATYADSIQYVDSRTGELCDNDTPVEYVEPRLIGARDVDYTVCALVTVPLSMSYRFTLPGYSAILPVETLERDSQKTPIPMFYLFDTPNEEAEAAAEGYLADLTSGDLSPLMYESKATIRAEFTQFQQMFLLLGGVLCAVIGLVGILNFFNAIMTGILSRRREFAVLQSIGMTAGQLKTMLIYEGLFYALSSILTALALSLALGPLTGNLLSGLFWYFDYHFTVTPVLLAIPVFLLLGWLIPSVLYGQTSRQSVVERLREAE